MESDKVHLGSISSHRFSKYELFIESEEVEECSEMRTSDEITFGQLMGSYRTLRANLSQEALASLIGISKTCFRKWEIDRSKPSAQHLQKLLEVFLDLGVFTARREEEEA